MKKVPKSSTEYICPICSFSCSRLSQWNRHIATAKHKILINPNAESSDLRKKYECECGKMYLHASTLCNHQKNCNYIKESLSMFDNNSQVNGNVLLEILKQNQEFKNLLIEQNLKIVEQNKTIIELSKANTIVYNNTNNTNNSNNSFNLNFFLNEQCKNAINLVDFIDSLQIEVKDLERTGKLGYVEGITQIFLNGLKELDVYNRPIHCTDLKRETVYVRDQDKWEKENEEKPKLHQAVKKITVKNIKQLPKWEKENPEFSDFDSKKNDEYMAISKSSLGGYDSEEDKKYKEMIIRNVLKTTRVPVKENRIAD